MRRLWSIIPTQYRRRAIVVTLTIFLRAILNFIGIASLIPILILVLDTNSIESNSYLGYIYNTCNIESHTTFCVIVCCTIVAIITLKNIINLLLYRYERDYINNLYYHLSEGLYKEYYSQGLSFIKQNNSANLTRNINVVTMMFVNGVLKPIATIISDGLLILLILGALVCYSPVAALLTILLFLPIVATLYLGLRRKLNNLGDDENKAQRTKARLVSDSFRGYAEAEVFNAFPQIFNIFQDETNKIIDIRKRHATIGQLPQMFTEIGLAIGLTIIILISINNSSDNLAFLLGVFAIAALRLLPSLRSILTSWSMMRYHGYSIDTLSEATIDSHQQKHQTTERMEFNNEIELRNVGFSFDENNSPILKNISLTITKGERIGIRGVSGVGKTTLFYIILGLYKPSSGAIYIDGEKLDDSNIRKWQNNIGYVSQSVFIADLSLAENIALGYNKDEIDYDRLNRVIELANLNDFVDSLPNGLDSHIGEQGCRVSGGQRQRIGIARALYRECDVLLLDEATSSLDNTTEQYINESIANLQKENESLTIIMIAHRESSLEYCNRIITLD